MNWEKEAFHLLKLLVEIPSINPGESTNFSENYGEKEVGVKFASYLQEYLPEFTTWKEEVLPDRFNYYASYIGGNKFPTILLETHLDTVDIQGMTVEPFELTSSGDKWYGRGACDAKGQLTAMVIGLRKALAENNGVLPLNVLLVAVVDEEHRHRGVDFLMEKSVEADLAIVGEPTSLQFGTYHKGSVRFVLEVNGKSAHSSTPWEGDNAIEKMTDIITIIKEHVKPSVENNSHPLCGKSSLSITLISGGEQVNIIPSNCSIHIDRRLNPQENWQDAIEDIKERVQKAISPNLWEDIIWNEPYLIDPPLENNLNTKELLALTEVLKKLNPNIEYSGLQFGCDASKIQPKGIPTVVFGPGSIQEAHTEDEWIAAEQMVQAINMYSFIFTEIHKSGHWSSDSDE
ncbi:M20/M25/M40 family metallo-hydrolase [Mammaliicoccus sciuri]